MVSIKVTISYGKTVSKDYNSIRADITVDEEVTAEELHDWKKDMFGRLRRMVLEELK